MTTKVLESANRDLAYRAVRDALAAGQQAYVIWPLVAAQDTGDELEDVPGIGRGEDGNERRATVLHDVEREVEHLRQVLPGACVEALHGRMSAREKDAVKIGGAHV